MKLAGQALEVKESAGQALEQVEGLAGQAS